MHHGLMTSREHSTARSTFPACGTQSLAWTRHSGSHKQQEHWVEKAWGYLGSGYLEVARIMCQNVSAFCLFVAECVNIHVRSPLFQASILTRCFPCVTQQALSYPAGENGSQSTFWRAIWQFLLTTFSIFLHPDPHKFTCRNLSRGVCVCVCVCVYTLYIKLSSQKCLLKPYLH